MADGQKKRRSRSVTAPKGDPVEVVAGGYDGDVT